MLSELWNGLSIGLQTTKTQYAKKSHTEHKIILEKLQEYDSEGAANAMREHILRSMKDILTRYE